MVDPAHLVANALYKHVPTGETYELLGTKMRVVVLKSAATSTLSEVPYKEFYDTYEDTGVHDHEASCCTVHGTHSTPHMGCILR